MKKDRYVIKNPTEEEKGITCVQCPYCLAEGKEYTWMPTIGWKHLKNKHDGKTTADMNREYPNFPTRSKNAIDKKSKSVSAGRKKMKTIKCAFCDQTKEIKNSWITEYTCDDCLEKGHPDVIRQKREEATIARKKTLVEKYGVDDINKIDGVREKINDTCEKKYGGVGFASEELAEKTQETMLENHGVKYYKQTEQGRKDTAKVRGMKGVSEKIKKTNIQKYDGTGFGSERLAAKSRDTMIEEYGVDNWRKTKEGRLSTSKIMENLMTRKKVSDSLKGRISPLNGVSWDERLGEEKSKKYKKKMSKMNLEKSESIIVDKMKKFNVELLGEYKGTNIKLNYRCLKCGTDMFTTWAKISRNDQPYKCPKCFPRNNGKSVGETEIINFIKELDPNLEIIHSDRTQIHPKELDIYIPSKKIAIEYDGMYTHSSKYYRLKGKTFNNNMHIEKTIWCEEKGIRLLHITDVQWNEIRDIVKNTLKQILGYTNDMMHINSNDCDIKEISVGKKSDFLEQNCVYGNDKSNYRLGMFYKDELIAVMTFTQKSDKIKWMFNNFVIKKNFHISGSAKMFFEYFDSKNEWEKMIAIVDRSLSQGMLHKHLGFTLIDYTAPEYCYVDYNGNVFSRFSSHVDGSKHGKFYDSGHIRFMKKNHSDITENDILLEKNKIQQASNASTLSGMKISPCVNCEKDVEHLMNLNPKGILCLECKSLGIKVNLTKIVKCYYCKEVFEISQRASNEYSVCPVCRTKGLKNPKASAHAKMATRKNNKSNLMTC